MLLENNWLLIPSKIIIIKKEMTKETPPPLGVDALCELLSFGIATKFFLSNGFINFKLRKVNKNPDRK